MSTEKKINKRIVVLVSEDQDAKLRLMSYHSGKSIGEIVRMAINKFDAKEIEKK